MAKENKNKVKVECPCGWSYGPTDDFHTAWTEEWKHIKGCRKPTTRTLINGDKEAKIDYLF